MKSSQAPSPDTARASGLWRRWSRRLAGGMALLLALTLIPALGAQAAGPAVVSVTVSVTNPDGTVVTEVDASSMPSYSVNVAYSCSVADCEGVEVVIDPTVLDPIYGVYRKESAVTFVPPFSPAPSFRGNLADGYTVALGDVAAGTGGSFALQYRINFRPGGPVGGSFFTDGAPITPRATITATNSDNPAISPAVTASWVSSVPAAPSLGVSVPASTRTDQPVKVGVTGDSRCLSYNGAGVLLGIPWLTCAASYAATVSLPANAVYVAGSGGSYDAVAHVVRFEQSGRSAAGGLPYNDNSFQVTFPSSAYPTSGTGCVAAEAFTAIETMTYLDGTQRVAAPASRSIQAQNCTPFAKGRMYKDVAGRDAGSAADPILYIPVSPGASRNSYWQVIAANQSNIAGIASIVDNALDQADLPVRSISIAGGGPAAVTYTLDDGTTATVQVANGATWTAPTGRRIARVNASSAPLIGPNTVSTGTAETRFTVRFHFSVINGATPGPRTNTATATIRYPEAPELGAFDVGSISRTVTLQQFTDVTLSAGTPGAAAQGGGTPIVGGDVTWSMRGAFENVTPGSDHRPQYVFLAPRAWRITPGSATVAGVAGVTYQYRTVTHNGQTHDAVIATWPSPIADSGNFSLPVMSVVTTPTGGAVAGTNNQTAYLFAGDADGRVVATYYPTLHTDVTDLDGDADVTEKYAVRSGTTSLAPTRAVGVAKEICRPDATRPDGCDWIADAGVLVGVAPSATSIKYRVTLTNTGNADLSSVVAYDVLPHVGDTGTTDATGSTPRGSTVREVLSSVSDVSSGLTLSYSTSTNPNRPEVFTGTTDPGDWGSTLAGASAIRAAIASLPANSSAAFTYEAALVGGSAGQVACNSVAATAATLAALEPPAVCATTQEANLSISVPDRLPLQAGRPGTIPYTVTNHGGSDAAPATVSIAVPADVRVTELTPEGWRCTASDTQPDGSIIGPVTLECDAVDSGTGALRQLAEGVPDALDIPAVIPDSSLGGSSLCFPAVVSGLMFDPDPTNNRDSACFSVAAADALLVVEKSDGLSAVGIGTEYTYDLVISNGLVGEGLSDITVTDTLPQGVTFVRATAGGVVSGQGPADAYGDLPGGTVTWTVADLAAAGVPGDGDDGSGASSSTTTVSVTVRVLPGAGGDIVNGAIATAADPFIPATMLQGGDEDRDGLYALTLAKRSDAPVSGVRTGQTLTYTVTAQNTGTAAFVGATIVDDLADVLDDASFVAGSAAVSVDGGTAIAVPDPTGDRLSWTGTVPAGTTAVMTYRVRVGTPGDGALINRAATRASFAECDAATGLDERGFACAVSQASFAATVDKTIQSLTQKDDGTWSIVYGVDVANPGVVAATYDLADELAFGAGLEVLTAQVTDAPPGVALQAWAGDGDITRGASVPAGDTHHYEITVTADSHALTGTPSALCAAGGAGGFANVASIELIDGTITQAEACAEPVEPGITKALEGAPVQGADGDWSVSYLITVTNPAEQPATGLVYALDDLLQFPSGLEVQSVTAIAPAGVSANPSFTAGLSEIGGAPVAADTGITTGIARVPAAAGGTPGVHRFVVRLVVRAGAVDPDLLACGAPGAGYGNAVSLRVGADAVGTASACADIVVPKLQFTKTADTSAGTRPGARVEYTITATNAGDAGFGTADPAMLVDDMTDVLDDAGYNGDARASTGTLNPALPLLGWSGALEPGGSVTITYSVTLNTDGDGKIVNLIGAPDGAGPSEGVPACAADPADNAGVRTCAVSLQLDRRSLAWTGMDALRVTGPTAVALLLLLGGLLLVLRRRRAV